MQMREKVGKSRNIVFFQWFVAPQSRKVGSLKRRVRSQLARWEMKNCTPLWREAHFKVKMYKTPGSRSTFASWDVEKVHAVFWREAHFEVNMYKTHHGRTTFGSWDVEKVHAVVARSTFRSQNVKNTRGSDHFWRFRCRFAWQAQGIVHLVKSEQNVRILQHFQLQPPLHHTTLQYITLHYNYNYHYTFATFYYTPLHYTALNYTQLHYTTLRYTPLHYITLHYTTFHYTSLH